MRLQDLKHNTFLSCSCYELLLLDLPASVKMHELFSKIGCLHAKFIQNTRTINFSSS